MVVLISHSGTVRRVDGYLPLRDYAVIGDGRTAALVGRDGSVDWLTVPHLNSPTVFAAVLDADRGGMCLLQPDESFRATRRYLPDTNVLETTFITGSGTVRVIDALTLDDAATLAPERELQRRVEGVSGSVALRWRVSPRFGYGRRTPRLSWRGSVVVASDGAAAVAVRGWNTGPTESADGMISGRFTIDEDATALLVLSFADQQPLVLPSRTGCDARLAQTTAAWRGWVHACTPPDRWRAAVLRSALALRLLVYSPSGAIAAAATSSLPEAIGATRNWDYRYSWIRDSAFTLDVFMRLNRVAEGRAYFWWLMHANQLTYPRLRALYRLDGGISGTERILDLAGYRGSHPVRAGNAAAGQLQLDAYGENLQAARRYAEAAGDLDTDMGRRLAKLADHVCAIWQQPDAGIWEVRSEPQHFTQSKMMCWIALNAAAGLAEQGLVPDRRLTRWRTHQDRIREFIDAHCISAARGCFVRHPGTEEVDAALLLGIIHGYVDGAEPTAQATVAAIDSDLRDGPYVQRYRADDGLPGDEGAFVACSFWLANALARAGRTEDAVALMDELVGLANDVGLYSEEIDTATGDFLGNLPQGLSHLALINAAFSIDDVLTGSGR